MRKTRLHRKAKGKSCLSVIGLYTCTSKGTNSQKWKGNCSSASSWAIISVHCPEV